MKVYGCQEPLIAAARGAAATAAAETREKIAGSLELARIELLETVLGAVGMANDALFPGSEIFWSRVQGDPSARVPMWLVGRAVAAANEWLVASFAETYPLPTTLEEGLETLRQIAERSNNIENPARSIEPERTDGEIADEESKRVARAAVMAALAAIGGVIGEGDPARNILKRMQYKIAIVARRMGPEYWPHWGGWRGVRLVETAIKQSLARIANERWNPVD